MNKNGLNLGQVVFSAVKVVLMVLFLIFEGVPTFIDRLSDGRSFYRKPSIRKGHGEMRFL